MRAICDTHVLLFWADDPRRLGRRATTLVDECVAAGELLCADISLWEIAMLHARGRLNKRANITCAAYIQDILTATGAGVLPITPEIAELAQEPRFLHGDPADRLIAATALIHHVPLITADDKLHAVAGLRCMW